MVMAQDLLQLPVFRDAPNPWTRPTLGVHSGQVNAGHSIDPIEPAYSSRHLGRKRFDAWHTTAHTCRPIQLLARDMSKKTRAADTPDFEKALAELEQIVERMEQGELPLDESLKQFERGVALTRSCQTALQQAEQKVEILMRKSGGESTEAVPFDTEDGA